MLLKPPTKFWSSTNIIFNLGTLFNRQLVGLDTSTADILNSWLIITQICIGETFECAWSYNVNFTTVFITSCRITCDVFFIIVDCYLLHVSWCLKSEECELLNDLWNLFRFRINVVLIITNWIQLKIDTGNISHVISQRFYITFYVTRIYLVM